MGLGQRNRGWAGALLAVFALVLVSGTSTWAQRSIGDVIDDSLITAKVKSSFAADPQVSALAIDVDTANGVVSLTGVVSSKDERQRAVQLAQGIEGVTRVDAHNLRLPRAGTGATREGEHAMSGTITAIDHRTGILSVRTDTGEHTFHFPPPLIKGLKGGDTITVHVAVEH